MHNLDGFAQVVGGTVPARIWPRRGQSAALCPDLDVLAEDLPCEAHPTPDREGDRPT